MVKLGLGGLLVSLFALCAACGSAEPAPRSIVSNDVEPPSKPVAANSDDKTTRERPAAVAAKTTAAKTAAKTTGASARCAMVTDQLDKVLPGYARKRSYSIRINESKPLPQASSKARRIDAPGPTVSVSRDKVQFELTDVGGDASIPARLKDFRLRSKRTESIVWRKTKSKPVVYLAAEPSVRGARLARIAEAIRKVDGARGEVRLVVRTGKQPTMPVTATAKFKEWYRGWYTKTATQRAIANAKEMEPATGLCADIIRVFGNVGGKGADTAMYLATKVPQALRNCNCAVDMDMLPPLVEAVLIADESRGWVPVEPARLRKSVDVAAYVAKYSQGK